MSEPDEIDRAAMEAVAREPLGVQMDDIKRRDRFGSLARGSSAEIRSLIAYRLREQWRECGLHCQPSYPQIAKACGWASHGAAIEAVRRMKQQRGESK